MRFLAGIVVIACAGTFAAGQQATFRAGTEIVSLGVTISDKKATFLTDLTRDDLEIFEDGKKQTIEYFARGDQDAAPELHIGLLFDTSGSMDADIKLSRSAAVRFLNTLSDAKDITLVDFEPDAFLTSPKVRAAQTAERVAEAIGARVTVDDRLAGGLDLATVEAIVRDAGSPSRVVLVGHDPDFSELVGELIGAPDLEMKKGAIARVDVDLPLRPGGGRLAWLVAPELLKPSR